MEDIKNYTTGSWDQVPNLVMTEMGVLPKGWELVVLTEAMGVPKEVQGGVVLVNVKEDGSGVVYDIPHNVQVLMHTQSRLAQQGQLQHMLQAAGYVQVTEKENSNG